MGMTLKQVRDWHKQICGALAGPLASRFHKDCEKAIDAHIAAQDAEIERMKNLNTSDRDFTVDNAGYFHFFSRHTAMVAKLRELHDRWLEEVRAEPTPAVDSWEAGWVTTTESRASELDAILSTEPADPDVRTPMTIDLKPSEPAQDSKQ